MLAKEHIDDLLQRNGNVLTNDGDKIGSIGQVYADDENGQPTWVTAKTGLFGMSESFVPLEGARVEGGRHSCAVHEGAGEARSPGRHRWAP